MKLGDLARRALLASFLAVTGASGASATMATEADSPSNSRLDKSLTDVLKDITKNLYADRVRESALALGAHIARSHYAGSSPKIDYTNPAIKNAVKTLQDHLNAYNSRGDTTSETLSVDGVMGEKTARSLLSFVYQTQSYDLIMVNPSQELVSEHNTNVRFLSRAMSEFASGQFVELIQEGAAKMNKKAEEIYNENSRLRAENYLLREQQPRMYWRIPPLLEPPALEKDY